MNRYVSGLAAFFAALVMVFSACSVQESTTPMERTEDSPMPLHVFVGTDPIPTPAVISGKGVWAAVYVPDDNDKFSAALFNVAMEALTERTNWLAHRTLQLYATPVTDAFTTPTTHVDLAYSPHHEVTLAGNTNIAMDAVEAGRTYTLRLTQGGAGGHSVTWDNGQLFGPFSDQPESGAGVATLFTFYASSDAIFCISRTYGVL